MNGDGVARLSERDQRLEDQSRRLWKEVGRCGTRRKFGRPATPAYLGPEIELAAWIVDAVIADNPRSPLPAPEVLSRHWREELAAYPSVAAVLGGGEKAVFALVNLGQEQRAVIAACAHGLSDKQIADVLGKSEGTVKATLSQVRVKFRVLRAQRLAA